MSGHRVKCLAVLTLLLPAAVAAAGGEYAPRTVVTPILHTGDPAPGIPGATVVLLLAPQIDGAGNVLVWGLFVYEGETVAHEALWYGGPEGMVSVAHYGMQAPDLPPGVMFRGARGNLAECGWIGITGDLQGPGIVSGFNDRANFVGPPGDIRKVMQAGEPAPGLEPGTIIDASRDSGLTAYLSDNATMMVVAWLAGPGIDESNDKVIWIGPRDDLQLIWRSGMEAPGTDGARFAWADGIAFNDHREVAFRGGLIREGDIDYANDVGYWAGPGGGMQLLAREGDPATPLDQEAVFCGAGMGRLNNVGDVVFFMGLCGAQVTSENNTALWIVTAGDRRVLARKGDPVPGRGGDLRFGPLGGENVTSQRATAFVTRTFPDDRFGVIVGEYDDVSIRLSLGLRDGEQVLGASSGVVYDNVDFAAAGLSDTGWFMGVATVAGSEVDDSNNIVFLARDGRTGLWYPRLRTADALGGRVVEVASLNEARRLIQWDHTGGSDGRRQGINDKGQFATKLSFSDGSSGVYILEAPVVGDGDADGDTDTADYDMFLECQGQCFGNDVSPVCNAFDIDWDGDIDLIDFRYLQILFGGEW